LRIRIVELRAGDHVQFGAVQVQVLWPPRDWTGSPEGRNEDSLALRFTYANAAVFMEGDLDRQIERAFAGQAGSADLLKVAHNGSLTSTSPELLAALNPRWAVISVGARNPFHHPRREILERLERSNVRV